MAARCWAIGKSHVKSCRPQSLTDRQKQKENDKEKAKERKEKGESRRCQRPQRAQSSRGSEAGVQPFQ